VSDDEIAFTGPLNRFVKNSTALAATWYHKAVGQWLLIALAAVHVGAIVFYLVKKRENLVRPMVMGDKNVTVEATSSRDDLGSRVIALVLVAIFAGLVAWIVSLGAGGGGSGGFN
jgi:uncharacterized membrane protein